MFREVLIELGCLWVVIELTWLFMGVNRLFSSPVCGIPHHHLQVAALVDQVGTISALEENHYVNVSV